MCYQRDEYLNFFSSVSWHCIPFPGSLEISMIDSSAVIERPIMTDYISNSPLLMRNRCFMRCCVILHASRCTYIVYCICVLPQFIIVVESCFFHTQTRNLFWWNSAWRPYMEREKDGFMDANNIHNRYVPSMHRCFHVSNPKHNQDKSYAPEMVECTSPSIFSSRNKHNRWFGKAVIQYTILFFVLLFCSYPTWHVLVMSRRWRWRWWQWRQEGRRGERQRGWSRKIFLSCAYLSCKSFIVTAQLPLSSLVIIIHVCLCFFINLQLFLPSCHLIFSSLLSPSLRLNNYSKRQRGRSR